MTNPPALPSLAALGDPAHYDPTVMTPAKGLGHRLGTQLNRHSDALRYLAALHETGRAELLPIGRSLEGRTLAQLVVSSRENLDRLETRRALGQRLADPEAECPDLDDLPIVVWVMAAVHGGEHSGTEAALALAYQLVAGTDATTQAIRERAVVVIDPVQNPDGRDRSINSYYSLGGLQPTTDRHSADHYAPWPGPRGSHYAFDLNRDWCLLTHPETRARVAAFLAWRPQVVVDLHEMISAGGYFFAPAAEPLEPHVDPRVRDGWEYFGWANAAAFDARGWDFFVGELFDCFYPGYGESWPAYHGAVGMTFEQDTPRTLALRNEHDRLVTLPQAIERHFVAAFTTCAAAVEQREALLTAYRDHRERAVRTALDAPRQALVIDAGDRAADAADVASLLRAQGIEAELVAAAFDLEAEPHEGGDTRQVTIAPGSVLVPLAQPSNGLVRALCEPEPVLDEAFAEREEELLAAGASTAIYDVTAWSLPHRHGLTAWWAAEWPEVELSPLRPEFEPARVAYLLPMTTRAAYQAMCRLAGREDWTPRVLARPLVFGGRRYERGTAILHCGEHGGDLAARLAAVVAETGCELVSADRAWEGGAAQASLGSSYARPVRPTRLALVTREPTDALGAGWLAYLLEQVYHLPYTPLNARGLSAEVLREYDVLLLPNSDRYDQVFGAEAALLRNWLTAGGTAVGFGSQVASWLCAREGLSGAGPVRDLEAEGPSEKDAVVPLERQPQRIPGAVAWAETDPYSYLTYGCPAEITVPVVGSALFVGPPAGRTVVRLSARPPVGWVPQRMRPQLAGRAWCWQERVGAGQLVVFAIPPTFRASWPMLDRLWLNAALYATSHTRE